MAKCLSDVKRAIAANPRDEEGGPRWKTFALRWTRRSSRTTPPANYFFGSRDFPHPGPCSRHLVSATALQPIEGLAGFCRPAWPRRQARIMRRPAPRTVAERPRLRTLPRDAPLREFVQSPNRGAQLHNPMSVGILVREHTHQCQWIRCAKWYSLGHRVSHH